MQTFRFVFLSVSYHIQTPIQSALHTLLIAAVVYTYCFIPRTEEISLPNPPGYAFNTQTHNYTGLMESLERLGVTDCKEIKAILTLSDYGRKGTIIWKMLNETNWGRISLKGKYIIAVLRKDIKT